MAVTTKKNKLVEGITLAQALKEGINVVDSIAYHLPVAWVIAKSN